MSMAHQNTRNRRNGAKYEVDVIEFFRKKGFDAERLRLSGLQDEGDGVVRAGDLRVVLEMKSGKNLSVRRWFEEEAVPEARNYAKRRSLLNEEVAATLVMKSHNKAIGKSLVTIDLDTFTDLLERAYAND